MASLAEKAAVIKDARAGASDSVARVVVMFGGAILGLARMGWLVNMMNEA